MKLLRTLVLGIVGMVSVMVALAVAGVPDRIAIWVGTGLLFALIAHVGASEDWKRISQRDLLSRESWRGSSARPSASETNPTQVPRAQHDEKQGLEDWESPRPLLKRLTKPEQRALFVVGVIGAVLAVGSVILFEMTGRYYNLIEGILHHPYMVNGYKHAFYIGLILTGVGFIGAFWYDATVGRLRTWIRTGE